MSERDVDAKEATLAQLPTAEFRNSLVVSVAVYANSCTGKLFEVVIYTLSLACNTVPPSPFDESLCACIYA
jgi:hypothetical protein